MALKKQFLSKQGVDLPEAYLKLEYIGYAATHHKKKAVMVAHYQVFASQQAYLDGKEFIDTVDIEIPVKVDLQEYAYVESKKLAQFAGATDILEG